MAMLSEEITTLCSHCNRPIPSTNIDLHFVHCSRNLEKCKVCGDMVPRKHAEDHYLETHAPSKGGVFPLEEVCVSLRFVELLLTVIQPRCLGPHQLETLYILGKIYVACSLCTATMERDILDVHKGESCPQRIITCEFCEFPLPAIDLIEHQVMMQYFLFASYSFSFFSGYCDYNDVDVGVDRRYVGDGRTGAERPPRPERRAGPPFLRRHLLFSIAITGIAFILGSLLFQKKSDITPGH
ncbi:hypothetical protein KSS87_005545 [Heliosperma pusillum]|nr:hypothetical protein KSS87_005545 [Heliosperma pusillum]